MIANLILAAGRSSRMQGRDKLLEPVDGQPVLGVLVSRALSLGATYVTLPAADHPRVGVLPKGARKVVVQDNSGMAGSLKAGISALPDTVLGVMILPADMPDITAQDMARIHGAASQGATVVRATTPEGIAGHPIYFAASEFHRFDNLTGDRGAHRIAQALSGKTVFIPLADDRARLDLDTPEDWANWRMKNTR